MSAQNAVVINTVNTFPTRVPVAAGLSIGLNNSASDMLCWGAGVAGDQVAAATPFDPAVSTDFPGGNPQTGKRVNISAVLEPDVDGDQYGDLTQDLCPQSKLTQAACPAPDTKVTRQPKKRSAARKAKIKFSSTVAGSTFTCSVDGKAAKPLHLAVQEEVQGRQAHRGHHRHERRRDRRPDAGDGEVQGDEAEALTSSVRSRP